MRIPLPLGIIPPAPVAGDWDASTRIGFAPITGSAFTVGGYESAYKTAAGESTGETSNGLSKWDWCLCRLFGAASSAGGSRSTTGAGAIIGQKLLFIK